jgi:ADP-dependent NAD(P)H-hydrate dehydratase / NAD(P)H-hydrate epimerase
VRRILPADRRWPLFGAASSRRIEQDALARSDRFALMGRAGDAVARLARALLPHGRSVWVACGPGNNGGDGLEAAALLRQSGLEVFVTLAADPSRLPDDARTAWQHAVAAGVSFLGDDATPPAVDLALDALLGLGASRAPQGQLAELIDALNALACPVLAIDLPSGLSADSGQPHGDACVKARYTLSLLTLKPGLFTGAGRDHAGEVWLDTLETEAAADAPEAWLSVGLDETAARAHAQHKGSFGDVAVVGGAPGMGGAARLAARAAHAAGAGRVFVGLIGDDDPGPDPQRPELMFRPGWWRRPVRDTVVVCGCGAGDGVRETLPALLGAVSRLVLDADALNAIAVDPSLQTQLQSRRARGFETVLTPHPLEAARLLGSTTAEVQADRLASARRLAQHFGCVVVLKGSGSVIASVEATSCINASGNASLATAGTGDVLAGWLGGHWSAHRASAWQSAVQTVWLHGHAADLSADSPLRAADLVEAMHRQQRR